MNKEVIIKRAVTYSKKVTYYKKMLQDLTVLEIKLMKEHIPYQSITSIKKYIEQRIKTLTLTIGNRITTLIDLQLKHFPPIIFGETKEIDGFTIKNQKAIYKTINYFSSKDLENGYIILDLINNPDSLEAKEIEMILNLKTGEIYPKSRGK